MQKKATAADPADPGPAAEIPTHKKAPKKTRAPRIPEHLPIVREELNPPEVQLNPNDFRRIGEEVRRQLGCKPAEFFCIQLVRGKYIRKGDPYCQALHQSISPLPAIPLHRHLRPHRRVHRQPLRLPLALLPASRNVR